MVDKSISMNVNDVLELEYLVEEFSGDSVSFDKNPSGDSSSYVSSEKFVFDPNGTGTYKLDINNQIIEIEVVDIPDSVKYEWQGNSFALGDSVWTDKVNSTDMSLTGDFQENTLSNGAEAVEGDGTDDYGTAPVDPGGQIFPNGSTWEFEMETTQTTDDRIMGGDPSDSQYFLISMNADSNGESSGDLFFRLRDDSTGALEFEATGLKFNDGNTHQFAFDIIDPPNNNYKFYYDGSEYTTNTTASGGPDNWASWDTDLTFFGHNGNSGLNTAVSTFRIHDSSVGGPTL